MSQNILGEGKGNTGDYIASLKDDLEDRPKGGI